MKIQLLVFCLALGSLSAEGPRAGLLKPAPCSNLVVASGKALNIRPNMCYYEVGDSILLHGQATVLHKGAKIEAAEMVFAANSTRSSAGPTRFKR